MESREVTKGLYDFFDGRIFHVVYKFEDSISHRFSRSFF